MRGMTSMLFVMLASFLIAGFWNAIPLIKNTAHLVLDPSAGKLLDFNPYLGMLVVIFIITLLTTLTQKYGTDQPSLRKIKEEQKFLQEEMKKYKEHPEKLLELQKRQFELIPKTFDITMKPLIYTFIPLILFFRWFNDYFTTNMINFKFFGFLSWFWFYLIFSIVFSSILRKTMNVA